MEIFIQVLGLRIENRGDNDDGLKAFEFSYLRPYCITHRVILGQLQEYLNPEQRNTPCFILLQMKLKHFKCPESEATISPN